MAAKGGPFKVSSTTSRSTAGPSVWFALPVDDAKHPGARVLRLLERSFQLPARALRAVSVKIEHEANGMLAAPELAKLLARDVGRAEARLLAILVREERHRRVVVLAVAAAGRRLLLRARRLRLAGIERPHAFDGAREGLPLVVFLSPRHQASRPAPSSWRTALRMSALDGSAASSEREAQR